MTTTVSSNTDGRPGTRVHPGLRTRGLTVGYPGRPRVLQDLDLEFPAGQFTVNLGPNGSGKSTLLLALAGLHRHEGQVELHGVPHTQRSPRERARHLSFLPQFPLAPEGITVRRLVLRGREPHRRLLAPVSRQDQEIADRALERLDLTDHAGSVVSDISGGQRQRAWIAMTLAQQAPTLLLDEPTNSLDLSFQVDILQTCRDLAQEGRTVVAVLHDLSLAARYAHHLVVLQGGQVRAQGPPQQVITAELMETVFDLDCRVIQDRQTQTPVVLPGGRKNPHHRASGTPTSTASTAESLNPGDHP